MKISFPTAFRVNLKFFAVPFYYLLFLFFFTSSGDFLHITIDPFNFKLNNLFAFFAGLMFLFMFKRLTLSKDFFLVWLYLLSTMSLSALFGYNPPICFGFVCYFIFNYFFCFLFPFSLFYFFDSDEIFTLYAWSFVLVGCYATAQVFFSFFGVILPFVGQRFLYLARGQGFSYEPSYYALYLTPFVIFQTTKFLLERKGKRRLGEVVVPNFLFLISTSTGCFFSYLAYLFSLGMMRKTPLMERIRFKNLVFKFISIGSLVCGSIWFLQPKLITNLFMKFFFLGFKHGSFADRWNGIVRYWNIFLDHLWLGTGLGGTSSYILLNSGRDGIDLYSRENLVGALGTNVTTEILAGLGLLGGVGFFALLVLIFRTLQKALRIENLREEERIRLISLALSLSVTFFALQFNQTIFRNYIWIHVGLSMGYAKFLLAKYLACEEVYFLK